MSEIDSLLYSPSSQQKSTSGAMALIEKTTERKAAELSTIYGIGAQHKEKILEGIRELEKDHDEEREN